MSPHPGRPATSGTIALPHSRVLLHQPSGGAQGQQADIEIQAREIQRLRDLEEQVLADRTGQTRERIAIDTDRDFILTAAEAKDYGAIDEVLTSRRAQQHRIAA